MINSIYKHYPAIGIYAVKPTNQYWGYVMDDFGNLIGLDEAAFDQNLFINTDVFWS